MPYNKYIYNEELSDKHLCTGHFKDNYINKWIEDKEHIGACTYCSKTNTPVVDMLAFRDFLRSKLSSRLCSIDDTGLFLASSIFDDEEEKIPGLLRIGPYVAPSPIEHYEDTEGMLYKYGLYTSNEDLNADINSYFSEQKWIKSDLFEEDLDEEFSREWDSFSEIVKHQRRYTFSYSPKFIPKERWRSDILSRIRHLCESMLVTSLEVDTYLYRGRPNENEHSCFSLFEELASPPPAYAKSNRMSAEGISLFYGALDKETVLQEIRNYCSPKSIDIGTFKTSQDLFVVDLFNVPEHLSFWMPQYYEEYKFLRKFHHEITQPLAKPSDAA